MNSGRNSSPSPPNFKIYLKYGFKTKEKWINDQCYRIQKGLACNAKPRAKHDSTMKIVQHSRLLKTSRCGLLCNWIMDHVTFIIQVNFLLQVINLFL